MPLPDFTSGTVLTAADLDAAFAAPFPAGIDGWQAFAPTLTQNNAVPRTHNYCNYTKIGRLCIANYYITMTGSGTASTVILLGLPLPASLGTLIAVGSGMLFDASASTFYHGPAVINTVSTVKFAAYNASNYLGAAGMTAALATNDILSAHVAYETAA